MITDGIRVVEVQRRRPRKQNAKRRKSSFHYSIKVDDLNHTRVKVCALAYARAFGVGVKRVKTLAKFYRDQGFARKGYSREMFSQKMAESEEKIRTQVGLFPAKPSHYSRKKTKRVYLDTRLNLAKMHRMYIEMCEPEAFAKWKDSGFNLKKQKQCGLFVKLDKYRKFVRSNFRLSFATPYVDKCMTCHQCDVKIKNAIDSGRPQAEIDNLLGAKQMHQDQANAFFDIAKESRRDNREITMEYDFQKVHPLPDIPIQESYYLRQLGFNTFGQCLLEPDSHQVRMTTWTEDEAGKGPSVVASLAHQFIEEKRKPDQKEGHILSDASPAQNRNCMNLVMEMDLVINGSFDAITHTFPVRGHSYLHCDKMFGVQENAIGALESVYTPTQYREVGRFCTWPSNFGGHQNMGSLKWVS